VPGALQNRRALRDQDARPVTCNGSFGLACPTTRNSALLLWLAGCLGSERVGWWQPGYQHPPQRSATHGLVVTTDPRLAATLRLTKQGGRGSPKNRPVGLVHSQQPGYLQRPKPTSLQSPAKAERTSSPAGGNTGGLVVQEGTSKASGTSPVWWNAWLCTDRS
jgi:hypothetical protein